MPPFLGVLGGIAEQVHQDLFQSRRVGVQPDRFGRQRHREFMPALLDQRANGLHRNFHDVAHGDPFWADIRQHLKPIYDEQKRQGLLTDFSFGTKSTTDSPDDWNVVLTLTYPNWAALDTFMARSDPITLAHYGSAANRTAANMARIEHGTVVASMLVRDQTVNPWK